MSAPVGCLWELSLGTGRGTRYCGMPADQSGWCVLHQQHWHDDYASVPRDGDGLPLVPMVLGHPRLG